MKEGKNIMEGGEMKEETKGRFKKRGIRRDRATECISSLSCLIFIFSLPFFLHLLLISTSSLLPSVFKFRPDSFISAATYS